MKVAILATQRAYAEHLQPVWDALAEDERAFFITNGARPGDVDLWLTASARDYSIAFDYPGAHVAMEHGTGLEFYGGAVLQRLRKATLIAAPNEFIAERYREVGAKVEVVGTPKMDALLKIRPPRNDVIAVSFHWSGVMRSDRPIWEDYRSALQQLNGRFVVLGHAHPRIWPQAERFWTSLGIEPIQDFAEVVRRADIYVCDHSSTLYEWAALDRPVVMLERGSGSVPKPTGLRYTQWADIGPETGPEALYGTVVGVMMGDTHQAPRKAASEALYPYLGHATARMVEVLREAI